MLAYRFCPCCVVPVITGNAVFVGAAGALELITALWLDVADAEPLALVAFTTIRSVSFTSLAASV